MSTTLRPQRRSTSARRFRLEWLESRFVLSSMGTTVVTSPTMLVGPLVSASNPAPLGPNLTVVGISPGAGSVLTSSPTSLGVTFDRPLDPFGLSFQDIEVDQLQADNSWLPYLNVGNSFLNESLDSTETTLNLSLDGSSLPAGTYRLVLPAFSMLVGADGSTLTNNDSNVDLGHFTIAAQGTTLDDATDVGPVTPTSPGVGNSTSSWSANIQGNLDFTSDPYAYNLYKITVPQGHYWRLGAEAQSQRLGGTLQSALAIFDSQGNEISFSNAGRSNSPNDAYLYTGLGPGTYYIGVSGTGNLPGSHYNGYDPVTGDLGTVSQSQSGGSYTLQLSLDTADAPTQLVSGTLNYADPLDTTPTGITLDFNGILDARTVRGQPTPGFVLTNQAGQTFPLTIVGVNEKTGEYTFLFDNKLPAGDYSVKIASTNGAKDLAGLTPVAPSQAPGVIMTFQVKPSHPSDSNDLGAFNNNIHKGIESETTIQPGASSTYRFVATSNGIYHFQPLFASGQIQMLFLGGRSKGTWISAGEAGANNVLDEYLRAGVYLISFRNVGAVPADLHWSIRLNQAWDSFFDNGIGQTSAMTLRVVNPAVGNSGGTSQNPSGPIPTPTPTGPFSPPASPSDPPTNGGGMPTVQTAATSTSPTPTIPAPGLLITLSDSLVGRPSTANDQVMVVTSSGGSGVGTLASVGNGIPQGIGVGQAVGSSTLRLSRASRVGEGIVADADAGINGAIVFEPVAPPPKADELVVKTSDWIDKLTALAASFLRPGASESPELRSETEGQAVERIAMSRDDTREPQGHVESASFGAPAVVGVLTAAGVRYYKQNRKRGPRLEMAHSPVIRGPHGRF